MSARLSALAVVGILTMVVLAAMAGKPVPARPAGTFPPLEPMTAGVADVTASPALAPNDETSDRATIDRIGTAFATWPGPTAAAIGAPGVDRSAPDLSRHRTYGEDGIFGLPGWAWRADDTKPAEATKYVIKWLGKSWPGPGNKLTR